MKTEQRVYKVYGGVYGEWERIDGSILLVPIGEPISYTLYATITTNKIQKAINCGRGYYNRNVKVIDTTTDTVVYEYKNGRVVTNLATTQ